MLSLPFFFGQPPTPKGVGLVKQTGLAITATPLPTLESVGFGRGWLVMPMLKEGENAPDFELADQDDRMVSLSSFKGQPVVVYFYPKDDTPGCTIEACGFRDSLQEYKKAGVVVLGISADDMDAHRKFASKYSLNFPLLSDRGAKVCRQWGVWGTKNMYGKGYEGILRTTFLIGKDGKVKKIFEKVKPEGHAQEILSHL